MLGCDRVCVYVLQPGQQCLQTVILTFGCGMASSARPLDSHSRSDAMAGLRAVLVVQLHLKACPPAQHDMHGQCSISALRAWACLCALRHSQASGM